MQQADFNHNDFGSQAEADKHLLVRFYYLDRPDKKKTAELGRPMFKEVAILEIRAAGERDVQVCRPATAADIKRFQPHYDAFMARVEPPSEGLPLTEWPQVTRSEIEQLSFVNVKTVEQMASVQDGSLSNISGGYALRDKAKKWLAQATVDADNADKAEMKETISELRAANEQMQAQIKTLMEMNATPRVNETEPAPQQELELTSDLDAEEEPVTEGAAVPVPAAPAAKPRKKRQRVKK